MVQPGSVSPRSLRRQTGKTSRYDFQRERFTELDSASKLFVTPDWSANRHVGISTQVTGNGVYQALRKGLWAV